MIILVVVINAAILAALLSVKRTNICWKDAFEELLLKIVPEKLTVDLEKLSVLLGAIYSDGCDGERIKRERLAITRRYMALWLIFSTLTIVSGAFDFFQECLPPMIERPEHGDGIKRIRAVAEVGHGSNLTCRNVELAIREKLLDEGDKMLILEEYADTLPDRIIGKNKDLDHVSHKLMLQEYDQETGISICWKTSKPETVNEEGDVNALALDVPVHVLLTAILEIEGARAEAAIQINVVRPDDADCYNDLIVARIDDLVEEINGSCGGGAVMLPQKTAEGLKLSWRRGRNDGDLIIMAGFIVGIVMTRYGRHRALAKVAYRKKLSMERDFPDFISKFILLLNAGLVSSAAIAKIAADHELHDSEDDRPLYAEMAAINCRVKNSNVSLDKELRHFSERSGIQEIIRFSTIFSDNINKGSMLEEKLEAEGSMLWHKRKKMAEELGRTADTKLVLPLMILLLALVIVTISPAMMAI